MPDTRYKPKTKKLGMLRYVEPNPGQSQGSYIYQFYRLNKKLIDAGYLGIGTANPYQHFKAETLDLLAQPDYKDRTVMWATKYQLGKGSIVAAAGGNTAINNLIRSLNRAGVKQLDIARLIGYKSSGHINFWDLRQWTYSAADRVYYFTKLDSKGKPNPNHPPLAIWFSHEESNKYRNGGWAFIHMRSPFGSRVFKLKAEDYDLEERKKNTRKIKENEK